MPKASTRLTAAIAVIVILIVGIYVYSTQVSPSADEITPSSLKDNGDASTLSATTSGATPEYGVINSGITGSPTVRGLSDGGIVVGLHISNGSSKGYKSLFGLQTSTLDTFKPIGISTSGIMLGLDASIWRPNKSAPTKLSIPGSFNSVQLNAINSKNFITGGAATYGTNDTWKTIRYNLGTNTNTFVSDFLGMDINNKNEIVGPCHLASGADDGVCFHSDATGKKQLSTHGMPHAINDSGVIVGVKDGYAYRFAGGTGEKALLTTQRGIALDVSNKGLIIGTIDNQDLTTPYAFIYSDAQGLRNLNDLIPRNTGWSLRTANRINNRGMIAGYGIKDGTPSAYILIYDR